MRGNFDRSQNQRSPSGWRFVVWLVGNSEKNRPFAICVCVVVWRISVSSSHVECIGDCEVTVILRFLSDVVMNIGVELSDFVMLTRGGKTGGFTETLSHHPLSDEFCAMSTWDSWIGTMTMNVHRRSYFHMDWEMKTILAFFFLSF